ncbi:hypothetical protein DRQ50_00315 [bacterium]|nr:MAG: hypothetical protein DRQ50_00315 [bacterium]
MAHAIITGDPQQADRVRIRLEMLGLTVAETELPAMSSVGDCDLVVHVATARHSDVPHRPTGELPQAPLLCLGAPRSSAWESVPARELDHGLFAAAVRSCVDRAWDLRRRPSPESPPERYRDFLSHELRSPLSVVATTLRALDETLVTRGGSADERDLIVRALRNVQRLERTVDWSQRTLMLTDIPPVRTLQALSADELAERLDHLGVTPAAHTDGEQVVETDPDLLAAMVQQLVRACDCLSPDLQIHLTLAAGAAGCTIRVEAPAIADLTPRVARIGLARPGETGTSDELAELASMLVPVAALDSVGARLDLSGAGAGVLEIRLPVVATPILA